MLEEEGYGHAVEEVVAGPGEFDGDGVADVRYFDGPEAFRDEAGDFVEAVDDETEAGELAGAVGDYEAGAAGEGAEFEGLETSEGGADAEVEFDAGFDGLGLSFVEVNGGTGGSENVGGLKVVEVGAFDLDSGVVLSGNVPNFGADVFTFSITIGPDVEDLGEFGLLADVFCYILFILEGQYLIPRFQ